MVSLGLQTTSEDTRLALLVVGLVFVAFALTVLTVWYWRHTDPNRQGLRGRATSSKKIAKPRQTRTAQRSAPQRNPRPRSQNAQNVAQGTRSQPRQRRKPAGNRAPRVERNGTRNNRSASGRGRPQQARGNAQRKIRYAGSARVSQDPRRQRPKNPNTG